MAEKVLISFEKRKFNEKTCRYLCAKLDPNNEDEQSLINDLEHLQSGQSKTLKAANANRLVKKILQSIIINDDLEDDTANQSVATDGNIETENDSEHETESESETDTGNDPDITIKSKDGKIAKAVSTTPGHSKFADKAKKKNCFSKQRTSFLL